MVLFKAGVNDLMGHMKESWEIAEGLKGIIASTCMNSGLARPAEGK